MYVIKVLFCWFVAIVFTSLCKRRQSNRLRQKKMNMWGFYYIYSSERVSKEGGAEGRGLDHGVADGYLTNGSSWLRQCLAHLSSTRRGCTLLLWLRINSTKKKSECLQTESSKAINVCFFFFFANWKVQTSISVVERDYMFYKFLECKLKHFRLYMKTFWILSAHYISKTDNVPFLLCNDIFTHSLLPRHHQNPYTPLPLLNSSN